MRRKMVLCVLPLLDASLSIVPSHLSQLSFCISHQGLQLKPKKQQK